MITGQNKILLWLTTKTFEEPLIEIPQAMNGKETNFKPKKEINSLEFNHKLTLKLMGSFLKICILK